MYKLLCVAAVLMLGACSTYGPSTGGVGYTDETTADGLIVVEGRATTFAKARAIAAVRAAELAQANGATRFVIVQAEVGTRKIGHAISNANKLSLNDPQPYGTGIRQRELTRTTPLKTGEQPVSRLIIRFPAIDEADTDATYDAAKTLATFGAKAGYRG